jgi:hypothetical protein
VFVRDGKLPRQICHSENELYVAEILNWRIQKLVLEPGRQVLVLNISYPTAILAAVRSPFAAVSLRI